MRIVNGKIITQNEIIDNGIVYIKNGIIEDFGTNEYMKKYEKNPEYNIDEVFDAEGNIVMPGLTCTHYHAYSAFARGMCLSGKAPENFIEILEKLWWRLDKALNIDDLYLSGKACAIECIKNGTTCIIDHNASAHSVMGSLNAVSSGFYEAGVRGNYCYEVSDRDGLKIAEEGLNENYNFIKKAKDYKGMISGCFGLHAAFTLSDETLNTAKNMADGLNCGFHVHVSEGIADEEINFKKYGKSPVKRLYDSGILNNKTIAVHGVNINSDDIDIIKAADAMVVHNPESNMNNAVGIPRVLDMLNKNITVGLGTDGFTSDMFREIDTLYIVHKLINKKPYVMDLENIKKIVFNNNSEIIRRLFGRKAGVIEKGAFGDLIVLKYNSPTPLNINNFLGHLVFGMNSGNVLSTIINGKLVMKNKEILTLDEEKTMNISRNKAQKLWDRI